MSLYLYRCLAHVINLAVQAFLKKESKAKYYNPAEPEAHEPGSTATDGNKRDIIGLVRAISVKVRTSLRFHVL